MFVRSGAGGDRLLPKFSVKRPYTVLVGVVMVIVLGIVSLRSMTADLLPSMNLNYAIVMTSYPGAAPETVETAVTKPVESAMATISNIQNVRSVSSDNYSVVILEFTETADMNAATVDMRESLDQLTGYFPEGVGSPLIMKLNPDMLPVMMAAVDADGLSRAELTRLAADEIVPEFERIEGVASVSSTGDVIETVQVILREDKIAEKNEEIVAALEKKFADAQKELDEAKEKLDDGEKELNEQKSSAAGRMSQGLSQIMSGKTQLIKGEQDIKTKLSELQAAKAQLETGGAELEAGKAELAQRKAQWEQIRPLLDGLAQVLASAEADGETLQPYAEAFERFLETLTPEQQAAVRGLVGQIEISPDSLAQLIAQTDAQIADGEEQIAKGEAELAAGREQVETGIAALEQTLAHLESQESTLDQALAALNQGQVLASIEMGSAAAQLASARAQMEQAQAQLDQGKDTAYEQSDLTTILTTDLVKQLLTAQNFAMPAGSVTEDGETYLVRVGDRVAGFEELPALPLINLHLDDVAPVTLGDVADVVLTDNAEETYAVINGNPGIILTMEKQTGYSTGDVSDRINARFADVEKKFEGVHMTALMDQGVYIDLVVNSVVKNILYGGLLAILILLVFLRNFRPTVIIACSIPLSVVTAISLMYFSHITLNVISLGGLALGIGMLVDNSIVVIENIYRMRGEGLSARAAAVAGAREVSGAIVASTLTTVVVFLPIVFIRGITKQLFVDMGLTIAYSLMASLLIALTLVPAMASGLLKGKAPSESALSKRVQDVYGRILGWSLRWKGLVLALVVAALGLSAWASISRGTAFLPEMQSTQASVTLSMPEGTEFSELKEMSGQVIERLGQIPDVQTIGAMSGGGGTMSMLGGGGLGGGSRSGAGSISMYLILSEDRTLDNAQLKEEILRVTEDLPVDLAVDTATMDMSALGGSGISIQIKGRDIEKLQQIAADLAEITRGVEGTTDVSDGSERADGQLKITVDKEKAGEYNLTVAQVFAQVMAELSQETTATTISTDIRDLSVILVEGEKRETTRKDVREMTLTATGADGAKEEVALADVASFTDGYIQSSIRRDAQSRYINVTAGVDSRHNIGLVSNELSARIAEYDMPEGYTAEMAGEDQTISEAMSQLMLMLLLAVIFVYLVMVAQFQSLLSPFIVMFTIPLAFTGGFLGLWLTGSPVSVIAMLGFVMLTGVIVNNGIVLVDYINQLRRQGMEKKAAIIEAGKTRMRPVFMTALTTILGLSTMALGHDMGSEMTKPMAVVVIGGLIYGTLLTLLVVPCMYDLLRREKDMTEEDIEAEIAGKLGSAQPETARE